MYLSAANAIRSDAWSLSSFKDHVFAASAISEAAGLCLGMGMYYMHGNSDLLGHPLVTMSAACSPPVVQLIRTGHWPRDENDPSRYNLRYFRENDDAFILSLGILLSINMAFLVLYLWGAQRGVFWTVVAIFFLPLVVGYLPKRVVGETASARLRLAAFAMIGMIFFLCSPPALELVETGFLIFTDSFQNGCSDDTLVLVVLDLVMAGPALVAIGVLLFKEVRDS